MKKKTRRNKPRVNKKEKRARPDSKKEVPSNADSKNLQANGRSNLTKENNPKKKRKVSRELLMLRLRKNRYNPRHEGKPGKKTIGRKFSADGRGSVSKEAGRVRGNGPAM